MRNPFIAGSWVRGDNFFGRTDLLREMLEGERDSLWVVGARRLGKTSLLKELEYRVQQSRDTPFVALYWDLQGSADARGLADGLLGSVEDSEAFRRATDVAVEDLEGLAVGEMLTTLVRRTVRSGWRLLLLVDEAEEFLTVARTEPAVLPRLRRIFQKGPEVRTVFTSTRRLARIDERTDFATSPFLQGFIPPLYLTPAGRRRGPGAARARHLHATTSAQRIRERTGYHPVPAAARSPAGCSRAATCRPRSTRWRPTRWSPTSSPWTSRRSTTDERALLEEVAREGGLTRRALAQAVGRTEEALEPQLFGLVRMGYLREADGALRPGNWFFERWLKRVAGARVGEARTLP